MGGISDNEPARFRAKNKPIKWNSQLRIFVTCKQQKLDKYDNRRQKTIPHPENYGNQG